MKGRTLNPLQRRASKLNWQRLQLKGAFGAIRFVLGQILVNKATHLKVKSNLEALETGMLDGITKAYEHDKQLILAERENNKAIDNLPL